MEAGENLLLVYIVEFGRRKYETWRGGAGSDELYE